MVSTKDNEIVLDFDGKILQNIFYSDDFKIYSMDVDENDYPNIKHSKYRTVSIQGDLPDLSLGLRYFITAKEIHTDKYGYSYKVQKIKSDTPKTFTEIYDFLEEILTFNQAQTLYKAYPDIVDLIVEDKDREIVDLNNLSGIKQVTYEKIRSKIVENYILIDLIALFGNVLSINKMMKMYEKYCSVDRIKEKLRDKPYDFFTNFSGIGFKTADKILLDMEKEHKYDFRCDLRSSPDRCKACIRYVLKQNEDEEGNTKINIITLRKIVNNLVPECIDYFVDCIKDTQFVYYDSDEKTVALKWTYETEKIVAKTIKNALSLERCWECDIEKYREVDGFILTDEQLSVLKNVCNYQVCILNGAAGSGKTSSTRALIKMLEDKKKSYRIFAPTGQAAKTIEGYTGREAATLHRGLGYKPPDKWSNSIIKVDIIIVDESSMVDLQLFKHLLDAIDFKNTKLLLIGDNYQLPPVSAGNIFHDLIYSGIVPQTTLTKIFRYGEGGLMTVATNTRNSIPYLDVSNKEKIISFGDNQDYKFIQSADKDIVKDTKVIYKALLNNGVLPEDIRVLTAFNKGDYGTVELNKMLRVLANRFCDYNKKIVSNKIEYYENDIVIQIKNNYKAIKYDSNYKKLEDNYNFGIKSDDEDTKTFICNGDSGVIKRIEKNKFALIEFNKDLIVYNIDDFNNILLGYAISIHKSQGSEFKNVIVVTPKSHVRMLNSNLIYVGLTRSKKMCYHLGNAAMINSAVKKKVNLERKTFLQELLKEKQNI